MNFNPKSSIILFSIFTAIIIIMYLFVPEPELVISVFIRLLASAIALYIVVKSKEWRILFLVLMFLLMAIRQILTLMIWIGDFQISQLSRDISELPGFAVTFLALISIIYVGLTLAGKTKIIREQEKSLNTLKGLLPICANCKKVRDDKGYWEQIDSYLETHSNATISHGLCEECTRELYGKEDWYKEFRKKEK
jgi:hypothetical protein